MGGYSTCLSPCLSPCVFGTSSVLPLEVTLWHGARAVSARDQEGRTSPDWKAKTTACTRSRSPSLASRRPTWDFTVASET